MKTQTVTLTLDRTTKGTVRYKAEGRDDDHDVAIVSLVYLQKPHIGEPVPETIRITVEEG